MCNVRPAFRRARGFTLVELGVVMTLVAIVATVAVPSFRSFIDSMDAKNASMELVADLTTARAEALKRNATVTVSPSGGNWANGWQIKAGTTVLGQRGAMRAGVSLSAPNADLTFLPTGRLSDAEVSSANTTWTISSTVSNVQARCVVITPTGSARSKRGSCA